MNRHPKALSQPNSFGPKAMRYLPNGGVHHKLGIGRKSREIPGIEQRVLVLSPLRFVAKMGEGVGVLHVVGLVKYEYFDNSEPGKAHNSGYERAQ